MWVTLRYFGHRCDGYGYGIWLCYTATDHQTITMVYSYSWFYLQATLFFLVLILLLLITRSMSQGHPPIPSTYRPKSGPELVHSLFHVFSLLHQAQTHISSPHCIKLSNPGLLSPPLLNHPLGVAVHFVFWQWPLPLCSCHTHRPQWHTMSIDPPGYLCYSSFDLSSIYKVISDLTQHVHWCNAYLPYLCKPSLCSRVPQLTVI